jgi:hypothetical protein
MASLPRPLIALLVATLAGFGLWYVELKPSSSTSAGGSQGVGAYQSAINQAHQAVATSNAANARIGAPTATAPAPSSPTPAKTTTKTTTAKTTTAKTAASAKAGKTSTSAKPAKTSAAAKPTSPAKPAAKALSAAQQVSLITSAIVAHKVVAVLFYNPAAADDVAMAHEIAAVPTNGGQVVKLAVPVSELTNFAIITQQIPVVTAPTLVLIDGSHQATTITGFADTLEITQRVQDALAAK